MDTKIEAKNPKTGANLLVDGLKRAGIELALGIPGGAAIPLYDALGREDGVRFVLTRHEQGAAHIADGYARATGKVAAVLVTGGPGATNTVTGIMTAYMDSVPMLVITGQSPRGLIGKDAFQETDVFNLTMPIVKHSYLAKSAAELPRVVAEAAYIAKTGRPGPVLIDVPRDVAEEEVGGGWAGASGDGGAVEMNLPGYHPELRRYGPEELAAMAEALAGAKRPVILAGHGVALAGAEGALRSLADRLNAPVATTLLGKGTLPDGHRLCLGMPGMYGTAAANLALAECDVLLAVGARLDERVIGAPGLFCRDAVKIVVDADRSEFGKLVLPDIRCCGDAKSVLNDLVGLAAACDDGEWVERLARAKKKYGTGGGGSVGKGAGVHPAQVVEALREAAAKDAILATDVGLHQMWAAKLWRCDAPGRFLTSGGAGTMGFGLPAAIGAQLGNPGAQVIALVGDGGFQMTMAELATAATNGLPVKVVVMNNHTLGMVRQLQDIFCGSHYSGVALEGNPDFAAVARAYGIPAWTVKRSGDLGGTLERALAEKGPSLVNVELPGADEVYPMVPPGRGLNEMVMSGPRRGPGRPRRGAQEGGGVTVTDVSREV
ncbi:MAG: biosynthetic-type acetolactate synthase large subunit [Kiritimatiellae bacterium]|nr:biosynthetic-type acetolactate synthase large subunit [Kiritimatiellia bacterium]